MRILVVSATELEVAPYISIGSGVAHLITGVGAPASQFQLQMHLQSNRYDLVIQAGIAGSFDVWPGLSEVVLVRKDVFADLGVFEQGQLQTVFDMGLATQNEWPYQEGWLVNDHPLLSHYKLKSVIAASVNSLTDNSGIINLYKQKFGADIESMEGAAFHYTCLQMKIPYLQLRSISNRVGERDKSKWQMRQAVVNLNEELAVLIQHSLDSV